jgi:hypothetical protein
MARKIMRGSYTSMYASSHRSHNVLLETKTDDVPDRCEVKVYYYATNIFLDVGHPIANATKISRSMAAAV